MKKRLQIAVVGSGGPEEYPGSKPSQNIYSVAEKIGFLLAKKDTITITGGKGGVMEAAARGACQANGTTIGVVKGSKRFLSNQYTKIEVLTGMEADGLDELILVMMSDAIIVVGGGAGTLQEIAIAYRNKKPIVVVSGTGGWSSQLTDFLDDRKLIKIEEVATAEEAVAKTLKLVEKKYA